MRLINNKYLFNGPDLPEFTITAQSHFDKWPMPMVTIRPEFPGTVLYVNSLSPNFC